jgi:hypothetical protein
MGKVRLTSKGAAMSTFNERERAFESKYAHDSEMQFRAEARRNKLAGLWAAGLLGKTGDAASDYAMSVVKADFEEAGIDDVVRKLTGDLGSLATEAQVRAKLTELLAVAKAQLVDEA